MTLGIISQVGDYELANYRTFVAEFPVSGSTSRLPELPSNVLPSLYYPSRDCLTSRRQQIDRINTPRVTPKNNSSWNRIYQFAIGWFGRRNSFAPSSSRYIVELVRLRPFYLVPIQAADRLLTPSFLNSSSMTLIELGGEKRVYYPVWLNEVNYHLLRQPYAEYPGEVLRETPCNWIDGSRDDPSNVNYEEN